MSNEASGRTTPSVSRKRLPPPSKREAFGEYETKQSPRRVAPMKWVEAPAA